MFSISPLVLFVALLAFICILRPCRLCYFLIDIIRNQAGSICHVDYALVWFIIALSYLANICLEMSLRQAFMLFVQQCGLDKLWLCDHQCTNSSICGRRIFCSVSSFVCLQTLIVTLASCAVLTSCAVLAPRVLLWHHGFSTFSDISFSRHFGYLAPAYQDLSWGLMAFFGMWLFHNYCWHIWPLWVCESWFNYSK